MNKHLLLLCSCILIALASCKKDSHKIVPPKDYHKITFGVAGFDIINVPVKSSARGLSTNSVDSSKNAIRYNLYIWGNDEFGQIFNNWVATGLPLSVRDSVPNGRYVAAFIYPTWLTFDGTQSYLVNHDYDTFSKKVNIDVSGANIAQDIVLQRIDAKLEVRLEDVVPANVKDIKLRFNDSVNFDVFQHLYFGYQGIEAGVTESVSPRVISAYTANNVTPFNVSIVVTYTDSPTVYTKTVPNVVCMRNKKTILIGKLFNQNQNGSATINVNAPAEWAPNVTVTF